jgi:hypothetical protein
MRQHVQKEAPQEFIRTKSHLALFIAVRIILPADGILDRLVHNAHRIEMRGDSMRKSRGKSNA